MTKWEYKSLIYPEWDHEERRPILKTPASLEAMLNEMGSKGWELVYHRDANLSLPKYENGVSVGAFTFKRRVE